MKTLIKNGTLVLREGEKKADIHEGYMGRMAGLFGLRH